MIGRSGMALCLALMASCTGSSDKDFVRPAPGTRLIADNGVSLVPPSGWWLVHRAGCGTILLTSGGTDIDRIELRTGITSGTELYTGIQPCHAQAENGSPHLPANITYTDVQSLFLDTLKQQNAQNIRSMYMHPIAFGAAHGFRFEYAYTDGHGLDRHGLAIGALRAGALDFVTFDAPALYYFDHLRPAAEELFTSIRTP